MAERHGVRRRDGRDILASPAAVVFQTLRNGSQAVEAWRTGATLSLEAVNLAAVSALPLSLDTTTQSYFNARIAAVSAAASGISALAPSANPFAAATLLSGGSPAVADPGYLEWCIGFSAETAPSGVTAATLPIYATGAATAWLTVANAVTVLQGSNPTSTYDTAARMYRCSASVAGIINGLESTPFAEAAWNGVVALPTILMDAATLYMAPSSLPAQQAIAIRYSLNAMAAALALFLCSLRTTVGTPPSTARLNNTDTLMDLAARETGNFEQWVAIAAANGLTPPYPGPTNQAVALSGRQMFLPGAGVQIGATGTPPSYPNDGMGVDWWFGPINGPQPAWNGDVATIGGFANFAQALGRRLQTPIGSLVYHQDYGSRIPGEVGGVQSTDEAPKLAAFGKAAISADKRTARVLSATASVSPGMSASFSGVVQPIGPGSLPIDVSTGIAPP